MLRIALTLLALTVPGSVLHAYNVSPPGNFKELLNNLSAIINLLIPFIFSLTFLTIMWGVLKAWVIGEAGENDIEKGKKIMLIGIIALVIMVSIWGILRMLQEGFFG